MNIDEKIKEVLTSIRDGNFNPKTILPDESREEVKRVLDVSEKDNFLSHSSRQQQPLVTKMGFNGFMLHPTTFVTRAGEHFLEGFDRNEPKSSTVFNIGKVENSALGNYNTVNNYSEQPLEDLVEFVKSLKEDDDKEQGEKLIDTLRKDKIQKGYLSKFDGFLNKYPKTVDLISSFLTSLVITKLN